MNETMNKVKNALLSMQRFSWEQGVAARAMFRLGDNEMGILMAKEAVHRQVADGRLAIMGDNFVASDPGANGIPVQKAAQLTGDLSFTKAAEKMADYYLHHARRTADGTIKHTSGLGGEEWRWMDDIVMIDALYHIMPFLAAAGYPDESMKQFYGFKRHLYDEDKHLYHHMWDEKTGEFHRAAFWSGDSGWAVCACVWTYEFLPASFVQYRSDLKQHLKELVPAMLSYVGESGLFHDVIDDPTTHLDGTSGLMLAFGIYEAVRLGLLDKRYERDASALIDAATANIDEYGILQKVTGAPSFDFQGSSAEAQAFYLLACAARENA